MSTSQVNPESFVASTSSHPNVLIIIADDLGIGDVGCFGNDTINTPSIDRLCREGTQLTQHLAAATLCTPSRAAFMTARYPPRYGLAGTQGTPPVLTHVAILAGLPTSEPTIGKAFTRAGYSTHYAGKWHLGSRCGLLGRNCDGPIAHGFNSTFWLPYTLSERTVGDYTFWQLPADDLYTRATLTTAGALLLLVVSLRCLDFLHLAKILVVVLVIFLMIAWFLLTHYRLHTPFWYRLSEWMDYNFNFIIMNGTSIIQQRVQLETLNDDIVEATVNFIRSQANSSRPFLAVHSFGHVHTPVVSAPRNRGRSRHGRYGDTIEEMDDGVGALLSALDALSLSDKTIVYFTSDHGGHLEAVGEDGQRTGGYNGLFKGGKSQGGMEGGIRVPAVIRYPRVVPPGTQLSIPTSLLDVLPTLLNLAGLPSVVQLLPDAAQPLDGMSFSALLTGAAVPGSTSDPTRGRVLLHHSGVHISALRYYTGDHVYKMHILWPHFHEGSYQCGWGDTLLCRTWHGPSQNLDLTDNPLLFDLTTDPYEDRPIPNTTREYIEVVQYLKSYLRKWQAEVVYPPSQFGVKLLNVLLPWLQPVMLL
ncbi:Sulfatase N-terminal [Trinorchestia longiramus]|nr:Sulfatase N-terminal [Trinorchestia longiramus]